MVLGSSSSTASSPLHLVICPWLAFGHLLPCLDLAERLASRGHRVTFVSTQHNIARLPPVHATVAPLIEFVALPLPLINGLPNGAESTNDIPFEKMELHWMAFDGLAEPFEEFLGHRVCSGNKPDWVIVDLFHHWAAAAALEHKVPCTMLLLGSGEMVANLAHQLSKQEVATTQGPAETESDQKPRLLTSGGTSGMSVIKRISLTLKWCTVTAIRSSIEWEPETVPVIKVISGKPIVPFGLLPPSPKGGRGISRLNGEDDTLRWLENQSAKSVMYVALGSEVPLSVQQVHELGLGLELSGTRFLWALRKPSSIPKRDILPMGFEERTSSQGLIKMTWVPQISILEHNAIGAFLTHCGWNSIIEGILFGHPLIMLPISGDQGPNARLMERKNVGVQVPRDENNGSFDRKGVERAVRAVMLEEEGRKTFADNARNWQAIVADKECQERYISRFIEELRSYSKIFEDTICKT